MSQTEAPRRPDHGPQRPGVLGLLAGLTAATLYVSGIFGGAAGAGLAAFAGLPLFLAALGWGLRAGAVAAVAASAVVALAMASIGFPAAGLAFPLSAALPAFWLARLALLARPIDSAGPAPPVEWYPLGRLLLWIAGLAIAGFLGAELLSVLTSGSGLRTSLGAAVDQLPQELRKSVTEQTGADWPTLRRAFASAIPGFAGLSWQLTTLVNLSAAAALLSQTHRNLRPPLGWRSLTLPRQLALALLLCILLAFAVPVAGYWAGTVAIQLFMPYFFLGLTVVHAIPLVGPGRVLLLGLFYFLMLFQVWPAVLVGLLGLGEQWFGLRARMAARSGREDR